MRLRNPPIVLETIGFRTPCRSIVLETIGFRTPRCQWSTKSLDPMSVGQSVGRWCRSLLKMPKKRPFLAPYIIFLGPPVGLLFSKQWDLGPPVGLLFSKQWDLGPPGEVWKPSRSLLMCWSRSLLRADIRLIVWICPYSQAKTCILSLVTIF